MKYLLVLSIFFAGLAACNPDKNKRAEADKLRFSTTDDAELFFRNLRRQAYDEQEMAAAKLQVFRHSKRNQEADYPLFQLALVINWRFDEAYLLLEPNEQIDTDAPVEISWQDPENNLSGSYTFDYGNKEEHLKFAGNLYNSILDGHELAYLTESGPVPFLNLKTDREVFRISMFDYYRLTRNIR